MLFDMAYRQSISLKQRYGTEKKRTVIMVKEAKKTCGHTHTQIRASCTGHQNLTLTVFEKQTPDNVPYYRQLFSKILTSQLARATVQIGNVCRIRDAAAITIDDEIKCCQIMDWSLADVKVSSCTDMCTLCWASSALFL